MIFKTFISLWTIIFSLCRGASCDSDASPAVDNKFYPLEPATIGLAEHYADNDDIDRVKPMLNSRDSYEKDNENFRIQLQPRSSDAIERNVNVNVNHHSLSNKRQWQRLMRPEALKKPTNQGDKVHRILELLHVMPNSNIDYNLAHPRGSISVRGKKKSHRKNSGGVPMINSGNFESSEEGDDEWQPVVERAVAYLRTVRTDLRMMDRDLRALLSGPRDANSYENSVGLDSEEIDDH